MVDMHSDPRESTGTMEYRVTSQSKAYYWKELFNRLLAYGLVYVGLLLFWPEIRSHAIPQLVYLALFVVLELIPAAWFYTIYYRENRDTCLTFDEMLRTMTITRGTSTVRLTPNDIASITVYAAPNFLRRNGKSGFMFLWERYHFAQIETRSGDAFIITSLLINNLVEFFDVLGLEVHREARIPAFFVETSS